MAQGAKVPVEARLEGLLERQAALVAVRPLVRERQQMVAQALAPVREARQAVQELELLAVRRVLRAQLTGVSKPPAETRNSSRS